MRWLLLTILCSAVCLTVDSATVFKREKRIQTNEISSQELPEQSIPTASRGLDCNLPQKLIDEIKGYQPTANKIIDAVTKGNFKGKAYAELETFLNRFGSRLSGSDNLESAIDYMQESLKDWGFPVESEEFQVPTWTRGTEQATLLLQDGADRPWKHKPIKVLGLGLTVGTPTGGINSEVLVVKSFQDLKDQGSKVAGKIVVFNVPYTTYGDTAVYRTEGALEVAKLNGTACLVRSVTPFSLYNPHTGCVLYNEDPSVWQIPAAAITIEDAEYMSRLQAKGQRMSMHLVMNDYLSYPGSRTTRNTIASLKGSQKPDQVVLVSGHIDSWDVGEGAMDDGGGMMVSAYAIKLLKSLNLQSKRTIQAVLWSGEEFGLIGGKVFFDKRKDSLTNINAAFESDIGTFTPKGPDFAGTEQAACIVQEVTKLLSPINATTFRKTDDVGSDIAYLLSGKVPGVSLNNDNDNYFWFHHSNADYLSLYTPEELDLSVATFAVGSYVPADLSVDLPRD